MESISIFDIYKIGVGPSSSHTLGPWRAALDFIHNVKSIQADKIVVTLYGSLSKTGHGHATDVAVAMGLLGFDPTTVDTSRIDAYMSDLRAGKKLLVGDNTIEFDPIKQIIFSRETRAIHPNTLEFLAFNDNELVYEATYLSVGGGFIQKVGVDDEGGVVNFPYPIDKAADLSGYLDETGMSIAELVLINEAAINADRKYVVDQICRIYQTMQECVLAGITTGGILPGGLNVRRRAKEMSERLLDGRTVHSFEDLEDALRERTPSFRSVNEWVSWFALAVNEENAALGRVVTSPTNGAAGVIPAVLLYYHFFCEPLTKASITEFFCTSGEVGALFKKGATISAAVGGCQAEIGVSSSMAAAGLTALLGGSPQQALMAAEIAMEHHLGLTCDPVGGLVQVPCIERNAMGANKAITAAHLSLNSDPNTSVVTLDTVIKSMWDTAQEMNSKYKETSEGGLAFNIPVVQPEC